MKDLLETKGGIAVYDMLLESKSKLIQINTKITELGPKQEVDLFPPESMAGTWTEKRMNDNYPGMYIDPVSALGGYYGGIRIEWIGSEGEAYFDIVLTLSDFFAFTFNYRNVKALDYGMLDRIDMIAYAKGLGESAQKNVKTKTAGNKT